MKVFSGRKNTLLRHFVNIIREILNIELKSELRAFCVAKKIHADSEILSEMAGNSRR